MIAFTLQEFKRAWRQANSVFNEGSNKTNARRLLLFYAVETGLKAVMLKRANKHDSSDAEETFKRISHDLNKLLSELNAGSQYHLPREIILDNLRLSKPPQKRTAKCGDLNQVWRYGGEARKPSDTELEAKLSAINEWIRGELQ